VIHEVNGWEEDDDSWDEHDDDWCVECQGSGRVPAMDFEAIEGHSYFACDKCENGLNSGYPWRR
jgi:hypothetical protein